MDFHIIKKASDKSFFALICFFATTSLMKHFTPLWKLSCEIRFNIMDNAKDLT